MTKRLYTYKRSAFDARDLPALDLPAADTTPPIFSLRTRLPAAWDQGQEGSCTGHGFAAPMIVFYPQLIKPAPQFIYWNERNLEGTVNQDAGAQGRSGCKVLLHLGVCPDTDDVYNDHKWRTKPSAKAYADALPHRIKSYHALHTLDDIFGNLVLGIPVPFGFEVFDSFEGDATAKTGMMSMPAPGEKSPGWHETAIIGYDKPRQLLEVRNSWTPLWGDEGNFWMPFAYAKSRKLADDFYGLRKV